MTFNIWNQRTKELFVIVGMDILTSGPPKVRQGHQNTQVGSPLGSLMDQ